MSSCTSRNASARADSYPHDWQRTDGRISPEKALETSHWYFSSASKRTARSSCTSCCRNASAWLQPNDAVSARVSSAWSDEVASRAKRTPSWSGTHVSAAPCRSASNSKEKTFSRTEGSMNSACTRELR